MQSNHQKAIKIICTIGPASEKPEILKGLADAGMSIARCNFSHGTHAEHGRKFALVRAMNQKYGTNVKIMLDTKGPDIRLGNFVGGKATVKPGDTFSLYCDDVVGDAVIAQQKAQGQQVDPRLGNARGVTITHKKLYQYVQPGATVLLCNGMIVTKVTAVQGKEIVLRVENGGEMIDHKSMAVPGVDVHLEFLRPEDIEDLKFGVQEKVDLIAASFVNRAQDLVDMRKIVGNIPIIAKIESVQAVQNLDEIIAAADGIMVARGDLGVEYPLEKLPTVQKMIIKKCNAANKFVVVATEMMLNMMTKPRPSRAETTDVANAVYDGADAVMTSEETAMGAFPVQTIQYMQKIAHEAFTQKNAQ